MTKLKTNPYYARLIKDLALTYNYTPLTVQDVAFVWKRSAADIKRAANELYKEGILTFNKKEEMVLTAGYKKFFKRNPEVALQLAKVGF